MVGSYGKIYQPLCIDERFDYVLFTNDYTEETLGAWQIRSIPVPQEIDKSDNKRLSRYPKTHPETLLSEYSASLYIDANIQIADRWVYDRVVELDTKNIDYAGIKMLAKGRDCIYRHAYDMCCSKIENDYNALIQMSALRKEGFPEHFGLNENNIIFRKHTALMYHVNTMWWRWIVEYSFRDQFSYMFCMWKHSVPIEYFLPPNEDAYRTTHFKIHMHNHYSHVATQKWVKQNILEKLRNKCRHLSKFHYTYYEWEWCKLTHFSYPKMYLYVLGFLTTMINLPFLILVSIYRYLKK